MKLQDRLAIRRVLRALAAQWGCPVWAVKLLIRQTIQKSYKSAMKNPAEKALWDQYFPYGKPTPNQYILRLGHAHENGEDAPYLFNQ